MATQQSDNTITLGTESWNVADGYVKLKVLRQLVLCDKLETIAIYGVEDIDDENMILPEMIPFRRVNALTRLKDNISQLLSNVMFAIRKDDRQKLEVMEARLKTIESMLDAVAYMAEDQVSKEKKLEINEPWFRQMLSELQEIKQTINFPINSAGLIFRSSEEISFDELLADLAEGG